MKQKILIVDDKMLNPQNVLDSLSNECEVQIAVDGEEALEKIKSEPDSVVLLANANLMDTLTGLYRRKLFLKRAEKMVRQHTAGYYVISCFDIDKFKVINDLYGTKMGDTVLIHIANIFKEIFERIGGIACRVSADNFAVLYPREYLYSKELKEVSRRASVIDTLSQPIIFSIGRYIIEDLSLSASGMFDRAMIAKATVKGRYDEHIATYDESMRKHILGEQEIVNEMKKALLENQFEVWYQPQFNYATGALIGSEALVRWRHPVKGFIPPARFIPIFEKNGFVYELDKYVWEQSCAFLHESLAHGKKPVPISVNISRCDIFREGLVEFIIGLVHKYELPTELLRLEITESAFVKSTDQIIKIIKAFKAYGFTMEIDDFGSGYSSLNTLKDIPADILKLDMKFLEGEKNSDKGGNIVASIVRMAKWIGMSVIAEGVETVEQAEFLKSIGCIYIQGFLYSKPIPKAEYEQILFSNVTEEKMMVIEKVDSYDVGEFWNPGSIDTLIFNSFVGGACVFEFHKGAVDMLRVNDRYVNIIGDGRMTTSDILSMNMLDYINNEDLLKAIGVMQEAIASGAEVYDEMELIGLGAFGKSIYIRARMRVIAHAGERYLFYCLVTDVSSQKESVTGEMTQTSETAETAVTTETKATLETSDGCSRNDDDYRKRFLELNSIMNELLLESQAGYTRMHISRDKKITAQYVSREYCELLGRTEEELMSHYRVDASWGVHPEDIPEIRVIAHQMIEMRMARKFHIRLLHKNGDYVLLQADAKVTVDKTGEIYVGVYYRLPQ